MRMTPTQFCVVCLFDGAFAVRTLPSFLYFILFICRFSLIFLSSFYIYLVFGFVCVFVFYILFWLIRAFGFWAQVKVDCNTHIFFCMYVDFEMISSFDNIWLMPDPSLSCANPPCRLIWISISNILEHLYANEIFFQFFSISVLQSPILSSTSLSLLKFIVKLRLKDFDRSLKRISLHWKYIIFHLLLLLLLLFPLLMSFVLILFSLL